jgi:nitrite reductase/ring-hydroxylating ferredoxin subunit
MGHLYWLLILPIVVAVYFYLKRLKKKSVGPRRGIDRSLTYPRQYAVGWYHLCDSNEIPRGQLKHVYILGREMVAFRGDDEREEVSVVEAYCVHLGANLGVGGRVVPGTNCIQCPFHLWEFNGKDGRCTKIPYMDGKIPEKVRLIFAFLHTKYFYLRLDLSPIQVLNDMV